MNNPLIIFWLISLTAFAAQSQTTSVESPPLSTIFLPTASISANGENNSVTLRANEPVSFSLAFDAATLTAKAADWWLIHIKPDETTEYFELDNMIFKAGLTPTIQKDLFSFNTFVLPPLSFKKTGSHSVYFGVDLNKNGNIDLETAFYARIELNIVPDIPAEISAKTVYNQAYQENFAADEMSDIIRHAENAYVLVDPFMSGVAEKIPALRKNNNEVGCYISIGTGEDWRADFTQLQPYLVKKQWGEWPGEYFVNQTSTGILMIMQARIKQMAQWQCDWVEFDNMDWALDDDYREQYAFQVSQSEASIYFQALCDYVHQQGMKCMAKNTVTDSDSFEGVLYESYHNEINWWETEDTWKFLNAKKQVIINHYNETDCHKIHKDYQQFYNDTISFICEDANLKKYVHF